MSREVRQQWVVALVLLAAAAPAWAASSVAVENIVVTNGDGNAR